MTTVAIGLGSNLGQREQNLLSAIQSLKKYGEISAVSRFHETDPVGYLDQPRFLNAALLLETELPPPALLHALLEIERAAGRDRASSPQNGPRTLDLDILFYGSQQIHTAELTVPHPEMHRRRFVLDPLVEIAPAWLHPVLQKNVAELRTMIE